MSDAEVERMLRGMEAFNRGDIEEAWQLGWREDAEWYPYLGSLEGDVYRGHDEITAMWRQMREHLGLQMEAVEVADLDGQIVVEVRATGTGAESGAQVNATWAQLFTMRDGEVAKVEAFERHEDALAEARR